MGNLHVELGRRRTDGEVAAHHYAEALVLYAEALDLAQDMKDRPTEAGLLRSVGNVLAAAARFDDAIQYYQASAKLFELLGMSQEVARTKQNIQICMSVRNQSVG